MRQYRRVAFHLLLSLIGVCLSAAAQEDVADVPAKEMRAGEKGQFRYFLIGDASKPPEGGFGLLLVLPGGDGSAEFHPFVKRIHKNALPAGYLTAQLVAVPSDDKNQIVWPTKKTPHRKQNFSTEEFVKAVVEDVKKGQKLDEERVFTLSWSSGGPAAYAASLTPGTPVKGSLVAMSVFVPGQLPPLPAAKGQRYFLLHSPDDQVTRYFFTRAAKTQLEKAGATVKVVDYPGGHGWRGDVFGNIRAGVEWLAQP